MHENLSTIARLFELCVKGTSKESIIPFRTGLVCHLTMATLLGLKIEAKKVYINTKVIKHMYDKRPAEEFYMILKHTYSIVRKPDEIYKNNDPKRGHYAFTKRIDGDLYFCSIEIIDSDTLHIVTVFRLPKDTNKAINYLKNYKSLWRWKGGNPHRSALVTESPRTTNTPQ